MTNRIRLAALALAAALALSAGPEARAESHGDTGQTAVDRKYKSYIKNLSDRELRNWIRNLRSRLNNRELPHVRAQLNAALAEQQKRQVAGGEEKKQKPKVTSNERNARELLRGAVPAKSLRTPLLDDRMAQARRLLNAGGLQGRTRNRLKALLSNDRAEMQRRQTATKPVANTERQARKLLKGAPASSLKSPAIRDRIKSARNLLSSGGLTDRTRNRLRQMVAADRKELQNRQAAQQVNQAERQARRHLRDAGPAADLNNQALRERISKSRQLLKADSLRQSTRQDLRQLVEADRKVLQSRQAAQQVSQAERQARRHLQNAAPAADLNAQALRERIRKSRELMQSDSVQQATRQKLRQLVRSDRNALDRLADTRPATGDEKRARDLLASGVAASALNGRALRQRIRETRDLLRNRDISRRTRNRLQDQLDRDVAELQSRRDSQRVSSDADEQARDVLSDTRSAESLSERQLRRRLRETRDLLQDPQLSDRNSRRLRQRLRTDRRELRQRVRARRNDGISIGVIIGSGTVASGILADRRASHALRSPELSHRIRQTQQVLAEGGISSYDRGVLEDMLISDRRELRDRLRARRERRRAELERQRRENELNIVIAPQFDYAPREDVAAAEAADDVIERQLVAPPTREIDRRYSIRELRDRPELRRYMPAIEVDSISFGFNEHFVREEEVDELERIGSVIERVIAKNPDEVFLVEGHTDAVGSASYNQALSVQRAEAVKNALLEYFVIDPANLETVGYGEQFLKIPTPEEEPENRRVSVRRITPLISSR